MPAYFVYSTVLYRGKKALFWGMVLYFVIRKLCFGLSRGLE